MIKPRPKRARFFVYFFSVLFFKSNIYKPQKFCGLIFSLMHLVKSLRGLLQKLLWICVNPQELFRKSRRAILKSSPAFYFCLLRFFKFHYSKHVYDQFRGENQFDHYIFFLIIKSICSSLPNLTICLSVLLMKGFAF